jgi:peptidoglycan/xylan/chitin deacetylase (PgdA/CDA1 family)
MQVTRAQRSREALAALLLVCALALSLVGAPGNAPKAQAAGLQATTSAPLDLKPIYRIRTQDPVVFITVDDGIFKDLRARELIEQLQIPVTSFVTAWTVKDRARYFQRVSHWGSIQNHSATHASFALPSTNLDHEICYTQRKLTRDFGSRPWMLRPPYGAAADSPRVRSVAKRCGIEYIVMWDTVVDRGRVSYREKRLRNGSIILLHFLPDWERDLKIALRIARNAGLRPANLDDYLPRTSLSRPAILTPL